MSLAKSFTVGVGPFAQYLTFGPLPRLSLVDHVDVYCQQTDDLTDDSYTIRVALFSAKPETSDEFDSGHFMQGPFTMISIGGSFALTVPLRRQPLDLPYLGVECIGNNGLGNFTAGCLVALFPPQSQLRVK